MSKKDTPINVLRAEYESKLRSNIEERLKRLPEVIDDVIKTSAFTIIASAIGIRRDGWHSDRWEIDHRAGGNTAIAKALGEKALADVKSQMPGFLAKLAKPPKGLIAGMVEEYRDTYETTLRDIIREEAHKQALKDSEELLKTLRVGTPKTIESISEED